MSTQIEERVILAGVMGSHSVGLNTPESDRDFMEVILGHEDSYLGLDWWGQQGTKERRETVDGVLCETTSYELRKFLRLCQGFNPNVIPLLYLKPEHYLYVSPAGKFLIDNRKLFVSKIAVHTFVGYAYNQLKKMGNPDAATGQMGAKRKELREKYGYDTKCAYHTIRLARMLHEFLDSNGEVLNVYRKDIDGEELLAIRNGVYTLPAVTAMAEKLLESAKAKLDTCGLPDRPDKDGIRSVCRILLRAHLQLEVCGSL